MVRLRPLGAPIGEQPTQRHRDPDRRPPRPPLENAGEWDIYYRLMREWAAFVNGPVPYDWAQDGI